MYKGDMSSELSTLLRRLIEVPVEDPDAVYVIYQDVVKANRSATMTTKSQACELTRRAERKMGQAIRLAQRRGEIAGHGPTTGAPSAKKYGPMSTVCLMYRMADGVSDEMFEQVLADAQAAGSLSHAVVASKLPTKDDMPKMRPTPRGRKTIEHMAISISAIAMGVREVDPGEVDPAMSDVVEQVFRDIGQIRSFLRKVNDQHGK